VATGTRKGPKTDRASIRSRSQPRAYEARHIELLKAAATLFAERGFHRSSIRDLAKSTGRSLAGLYYYFSGKEELLFQIQHHCYSALLDEVRGLLQNADTAHDRLIIFISHHIAYFRHNMDEMKVLAHEDLTLTGEYLERITALKRDYSRILVDIVAAASSDDDDHPGRPSPDVAAFVLFGMMNWLYTWPKRLRRLPAEELAETVAQIFLCGYPGCTGPDLADLRERLVCNRQGFWKRKAI
jgi:AcrR family transcriptional regulator